MSTSEVYMFHSYNVLSLSIIDTKEIKIQNFLNILPLDFSHIPCFLKIYSILGGEVPTATQNRSFEV